MEPTDQEAVLRLEKTIFEKDGGKMVVEKEKGLIPLWIAGLSP